MISKSEIRNFHKFFISLFLRKRNFYLLRMSLFCPVDLNSYGDLRISFPGEQEMATLVRDFAYEAPATSQVFI